MRRNCPGRNAGFTLTELLVVLLLIGVFTGVMLAEMRGTYEDALLRSTARDLMSGLSVASSQAVSLNRQHRFELDTANHTFSVHAQEEARATGDVAPSSREVRTLDDRVLIEIREPAGDSDEEPEEPVEDEKAPPRSIVRFFPDGTADSRELVLSDRTGTELVLRINPVTGRVRVIEEGAVP